MPQTNYSLQNASAQLNTSQKAVGASPGGLAQNFVGCSFTNTGTATTSGTSASSMIPAGAGTLVFPANFFVAGKTVRVRCSGTLTTAAAPGTVTPNLNLGASNVWAGSAQTPVASQAMPFELEAVITCLTVGAGGTAGLTAKLAYLNGQVTSPVYLHMNNGASRPLDTTASNTLTLTSTNSIASGAVFVVTNFSVEILN